MGRAQLSRGLVECSLSRCSIQQTSPYRGYRPESDLLRYAEALSWFGEVRDWRALDVSIVPQRLQAPPKKPVPARG